MSGQPYPPMQPPVPPDVSSTKLLAGILGILFGGLGIHRFILGDVSGGIIRIVITVLTCGLGSVIGLIEGIIYLTKTPEEFKATYIDAKKEWF
jgi:TM2 domain-containing membrane protein YozV